VADPALILASASPRRLDLLRQIGCEPQHLIAASIDEIPLKNELPRVHAIRLAREKVEAVFKKPEIAVLSGAFVVLAADTVVGVGRRILPKAETEEDARACLALLSGRAHRVHTALALIGSDGQRRLRHVETKVGFKRLSQEEIETYIASKEWKVKRVATQFRAWRLPISIFFQALILALSACHFTKLHNCSGASA